MPVIINDNQTWFSNKWVSLKLFNDCLNFVDEKTELGKKIVFLDDVSIDTIDLTYFGSSAVKEFSNIVDKVIEYNEKLQGQDMAAPEYYPVYKKKILELKQMLSEID